MRVPAHIRYGDDWTLLFDPYYRNRRLWLRLLPWKVVNALGINRPVSKALCALGRYPKPPHYLVVPPCGWCGKHHGRRWP